MKHIFRLVLIYALFTNLVYAADISSWKNNYASGNDVWIELKDKPDNPKDWIGIYPADSNNSWSNVVQWSWAKDTSPTQIDEGDWYKFTDLPDGNYEVRFFLNNTYAVEDKYKFSVAGAVDISSWKDHYASGNDVWIELKNKPNNPEDWVGIYPADSNNSWSNVVDWSWAKDTSPTQVDQGDWYKFTDLPDGNYEARLFFNNTYHTEARVGFTLGNDHPDETVYPPNSNFSPIDTVAIDKPAKFASYQDNAFNDGVKRTVTRITDRENDKKVGNSHPYPKQGTPWNSDMSLLRLDRRIYDAKTLKEIELTKGKTGREVDSLFYGPTSAGAGIRWSKKDPNVLYVIGGNTYANRNSFFKLTLSEDRTSISGSVIFDLKTTGIESFSLGHGEGNIDYDDRYVVLSATKGTDIYAVLLDIKEKRLIWDAPKKLAFNSADFDWITVSPSGKYILATSAGKVYQYHANTFEPIRTLAEHAGHGDIGYAENGHEMFIQLETGENIDGNSGIFGYDLENQQRVELLESNYGGGHISCRNYQLKGWCYVSTNVNRYKEVFAIKLDGGSQTVRRYAQTHAVTRYANNTGWNSFPNVSPDGSRMLFMSDLGEENLSYNNRDTYQVTIER